MLQQDEPGDYVVSTGVGTSVRQFLDYSFSSVNLDWNEFVVFDTRFVRPTEVDSLIGDAEKARRELGWRHTVGASELANLMTEFDLKDTTVSGGIVDSPNKVWKEWLE